MTPSLRISETDAALVSHAVTEAEARSDAEIATIVAERSDQYHDVPLLWAGLAALLTLSGIAAFPGCFAALLDRMTGGWHVWSTRELLTAQVLAVTAIFLAGLCLFGWAPLRMALIPGKTKTRRVRDRAIVLFKASTEHRTLSRTGVLIYLSLAEHRAEIVADEAIVARVSADQWATPMAVLIDHLKAGRPGEGMAGAVRAIGEILAGHFPHSGTDPDEMPNRMIQL